MNKLHILVAFLAYLGVAFCRETNKNNKNTKPVPNVAHSIINLGKMEVSFHFDSKDSKGELPSKSELSTRQHSSSSFIWKPESMIEESCPCHNSRTFKETSHSNPSNILSKILMSNDLFSFNKEPLDSTLCCNSHEQMEEAVFLEYGPQVSLGDKSFPITNIIPQFMFGNMKPLSPRSSTNPKTIDILLFPQQKGLKYDVNKSKVLPKKKAAKDEIHVVGVKPKNEIKWMPASPLGSSIKKDLTIHEKEDKKANVQDYKKAENVNRNEEVTIVTTNAL